MISDLAVVLSAAVGFTASIMVMVATVLAVKRVISRQRQARQSALAAGAPAEIRNRTCRAVL